MRYLRIILFMLLLPGSPLQAAELTSKAQTRQFADQTVGLFLEEKFAAAFGNAKLYWPLPQVEIDGLVNQVKQQWPIVQQRFGRPVGMEFIREEAIGESFLRYYYLHKFKNHAIYWRFDFYKPESVWKINSILFLDSLDDLYR